MAAFARSMASNLTTEVGTDPVEDNYRASGSLKTTAEVFYLPSGEIAGGKVHFRQPARSRCNPNFECGYAVSGTYGAQARSGATTLHDPQPVQLDVGYWEFDQ